MESTLAATTIGRDGGPALATAQTEQSYSPQLKPCFYATLPRHRFAPSEESAADLGLLSFPPVVQQWVDSGAVFIGGEAAPALPVSAAAGVPVTPHSPLPSFLRDHEAEGGLMSPRHGGAPSRTASAPHAIDYDTRVKPSSLPPPTAGTQQDGPAGQGPAATGTTPPPPASQPQPHALVSDLATSFQARLSELRAALTPGARAAAAAALAAEEAAAAAADRTASTPRPPDTSSPSGTATSGDESQKPSPSPQPAPPPWVLHSELAAKLPPPPTAAYVPGSLYQVAGGAGAAGDEGLGGGGEDGGGGEYVELVSDREVPRRRRVEVRAGTFKL